MATGRLSSAGRATASERGGLAAPGILRVGHTGASPDIQGAEPIVATPSLLRAYILAVSRRQTPRSIDARLTDSVRALEVALATPEPQLLLACRSTLAGLLRCLLVAFGDLSADIVEGRFRGRFSRARFFTGSVGLLILLRHACTPRRSVGKSGPLEECKSRHSGGGGCYRLYSRPRGGPRRGAYGESVAGSPPPDCFNRVMRSSTSRSHLSPSPLASQ
jgi:hypothetical protein